MNYTIRFTRHGLRHQIVRSFEPGQDIGKEIRKEYPRAEFISAVSVRQTAHSTG